MIFAGKFTCCVVVLQQMGRRSISVPTNIFAEAPSLEVLYELDKVKKVGIILLVCVAHSCMHVCTNMCVVLCAWL